MDADGERTGHGQQAPTISSIRLQSDFGPNPHRSLKPPLPEMREKEAESEYVMPSVREWANQVFSRASGAPLRDGNRVTLLKDAAENYPAWLQAIADARHTIDIEMYIIHEDDEGERFADALLGASRHGVEIRPLYDWCRGHPVGPGSSGPHPIPGLENLLAAGGT